jgi:hypothetical protein
VGYAHTWWAAVKVEVGGSIVEVKDDTTKVRVRDDTVKIEVRLGMAVFY